MKSLLICLALLLPAALLPAHAADDPARKDGGAEFIKGRLFPPELVMRHQARLNLTEKQRATIKNELKSFQSRLAEVQWDMLEASTGLDTAIDALPVNREAVMQQVERVLLAENRVKLLHLEMLIAIKNALDAEQVAYLKSVPQE
jgi:Spy/CpxP family protein refolding chaperone